MKITSLSNTKIKEAVKLRNRKGRKQAGLTLIDGICELSHAQKAGVELDSVFVCPEILVNGEAKQFMKAFVKQGTPVYEVTQKIFTKIAYGDRKEGLLAICRPQLKSFAQIKLGPNPFLVIVERVEKPGNLGAIARSCDGAGVDALIVSDLTTDLYNPNVIRASLGTIFDVPLVQDSNERVLNFLKEKKIISLAATPSAGLDYTQVQLTGPAAIILGSEKEGLSEFWMHNADRQMKIPMQGQVDSLNVSNTTAILVYEALRQRTHA